MMKPFDTENVSNGFTYYIITIDMLNACIYKIDAVF